MKNDMPDALYYIPNGAGRPYMRSLEGPAPRIIQMPPEKLTVPLKDKLGWFLSGCAVGILVLFLSARWLY